MEHARQNGWVILTCGEKPSVIQIRSEDVSPEAAGTAVRMMSAELEHG
jgi:predicted nuclease of predicted toxin-antitoxin system